MQDETVSSAKTKAQRKSLAKANKKQKQAEKFDRNDNAVTKKEFNELTGMSIEKRMKHNQKKEAAQRH